MGPSGVLVVHGALHLDPRVQAANRPGARAVQHAGEQPAPPTLKSLRPPTPGLALQEMMEFTGDADAYGTIADCYTDLGEFEKAAVYYDKYIERMKDGPV